MTALVLLPGLDGTGTLHADFLAVARQAFDSAQVVVYPPDRRLDYAALERFARESLPRTGRCVLVGESFSGPVALRIAADPPSNLAGLVLSTTFARTPMPWLSPLAPLAAIAPVRAMPDAFSSWLMLGRWSTPRWRDALRAALASVDIDVLRHRVACALRADESHRLASIRVPTLCLRATEDRLLPPGAAREMAAHIAGAECVDLECPHFLLQSAPDAAVRAIARVA